MTNFFVKIFIGLILTGITSTAQAQERIIIDQVVAIVGGNMVMQSEIEAQYFQLQAQGMGGGENLKCRIFEDLLFQKLLLNQAKLDSIDVSDKAVEAELNGRLQGFIQQIGSVEKLEEYFNKSLDEIKADFRTVVRDQLITQQMQSEISGDIKVTPSDVNKFFKDMPKDSLPLIQAEMEYLQIVRYPKAEDSEIERIKEQLKTYKSRVESGAAKFATLAVLYSEDPGSAKEGGELGYVGRGELVPEFAAVAFNLTQNQVSGVVKTDYGYHIIQLVDKKGEQINVRHILLKPKTSTKAKQREKQLLDSISTVIRTDTLTFEQAALYYSQDEDTRLNGGLVVNPYSGVSKFEIDQISSDDYYYLKNMKVGQITDPVAARDKSGREIYKILMLNFKSEPHVANMQDDYQRIQDMALNKKKEKKMVEWISEKQKTSYIKIDPKYRACKFDFEGWIR